MFRNVRSRLLALSAAAVLSVSGLFSALPTVAPVASVAAVATFAVLEARPAEASALSNYFQNKFIDWFLRGQTYTAPTTVYVALSTSTSSAAACGTEVSGGSYARVAVPSSLANWAGTQSSGSTAASSGTSGQTSNNAAITFASPTASWGSITGFCIYDASTGGNLLIYAPLTTPKTVNNGDAAPSFASGALTYTISQLVIVPRVDLTGANDDQFRVAA